MATTQPSLFTFNLQPGSVSMGAQPAPAQQSPSPLMANKPDTFQRSMANGQPQPNSAFFLPATPDSNFK